LVAATPPEDFPEIWTRNRMTTFVCAADKTPAFSADGARFSMLAEAMASGVVLHRGAQPLYVNEAMVSLTGLTRDHLLGMPFWEIAHESSRSEVRARVQARLRGEHPPDRYEFQLDARRGHDVWVEVTGRYIDFEGAMAILATYVDVTERRQAELAQRQIQQSLAQIIAGSPVAKYVIDHNHKVTHWNRACEQVTGVAAGNVIGTRNHWRAFHEAEQSLLADLVVDGAREDTLARLFPGSGRLLTLIDGACEARSFFPGLGDSGRWLNRTAAPLRDSDGRTIGAIETLQDVTDLVLAEAAANVSQVELALLVEKRTAELADTNARLGEDIRRREQVERDLLDQHAELVALNVRLCEAQNQLLQSEKLASIGQLAAGVAHEINNPIGYVHSNIGSLDKYLTDLFTILGAYEALGEAMCDLPGYAAVQKVKSDLDLAFLLEDIPMLMHETNEGIGRVRKIVQDLKDFSRGDSNEEWQWTNLHHGIDSTLNIVNNEIKYCAEVVRRYGDLPDVQCLPSQLNQVFMNLLVNAAHAIKQERGCITITTGHYEGEVWIEISDNGCGIPPENLQRIFDPFFTTKPVGKGTGLGLSLSYGMVQKHHGHIDVESKPGVGTTFRVWLPVCQDGVAVSTPAVKEIA
jgi:PAS domain S-box-containing protein